MGSTPRIVCGRLMRDKPWVAMTLDDPGPEIAMTPTTEAGKAHAEAWIDAVEIEWGLGEGDRESMLGEVAAIEAEAVAVERARIAEAMRELEPCCDDAAVIIPDRRTLRAMCQCGAYVWDAVLAIINPEETER